MSKLTVELVARIDDYREAAQDEIRNMSKGESSAAAREALEDAIAEAIARGTLEHAEPARGSFYDLIDAVLSAANARITSPGWSDDYDKARGKLERYVSALESERDEARRAYSDLWNSSRADIEEISRLGMVQNEHLLQIASLQRERDEARAEIARLEEALSATDNTDGALRRWYAQQELETASGAITRLKEIIASRDSTPADCAELDSLKTQLADAERARDDYYSKLHAFMSEAASYRDGVIITIGWLEALEQGYLTPEGVMKGAQVTHRRLDSLLRNLLHKAKALAPANRAD